MVLSQESNPPPVNRKCDALPIAPLRHHGVLSTTIRNSHKLNKATVRLEFSFAYPFFNNVRTVNKTVSSLH